MGHFVTSQDIPTNGEHLDQSKVSGLKMLFGGVAVVGTLVSFAFLTAGPDKWREIFAYSWLFAFFYFLTIAMGGCFWVLLHNVSNSGWGTSVRRTMENVGFVFPFMAIFALPLLCPEVQKSLFEWMNAHRDLTPGIMPAAEATKAALHHSPDPHDHALYMKFFYLNIPMWYLRFALYFIGLSLTIWFMRRLSVGQDTDPNPTTKRLFRARFHASWGIPIFACTLTFGAIDWVMGLNYTWFSTMWGVYVFAGSALNSITVILLVTILLRKHGYLKKVVTQEHDHLMGKLMFAFTIFWAYISFSQFFLYWYANITEETTYFLLRNTGNWNVVSIALVALHFFAPFLLLLRSDVKKNHKFMTVLAVYLLVLHMVDVYHMVIPERGPSLSLIWHQDPQLWVGGLGAFVLDLVAFVVVGSGFVFFLLRNMSSAALYPNRDPRILESANVSN